MKNYKFHSTGQYRNAVKNVQMSVQFKGIDDNGEAIIDRNAPLPKITYRGSVKLHGTNASLIMHEDGCISCHSKGSKLDCFDELGKFELFSDNAEFAQTMERQYESVVKVFDNVKEVCVEVRGKVIFPLKVSGEWVGPGVQNGVGISNLNKKAFFIFGVKVGEETTKENQMGWLPPAIVSNIETGEFFNIYHFPTKDIEIDFTNPVFSQNSLVEYTEEIEKECPVSKVLQGLGLISSDVKELVGEGLVWVPLYPEYCYDSGNWFKTKGKKHSVSKVKSVAAVDPEKIRSIQEFIEYAVTDNRLEQGVGEVGLDEKLYGTFIGWVNKDINKEEGDVLEENNLSMKDVGKYVATRAREYYTKTLNEVGTIS